MFVQRKKQTTLTGRPAPSKGRTASGTTAIATSRSFITRTPAQPTTVSNAAASTARQVWPHRPATHGVQLPKSTLFHPTTTPPMTTTTVRTASSVATTHSTTMAKFQDSGYGGLTATAPTALGGKRKLPPSFTMTHPTLKRNPGSRPTGTRPIPNHSRKQSSPTASAVPLSEEQQEVLNFVFDTRKSVFITGSAGTGKSVVMRAIIQRLEEMEKGINHAITAPTGIAALNIGGTTIHSFAGIGLGKQSVEFLVNKIMKNRHALSRWTKTDVLIIDEVSMLDGDLFDKLEQIARQVRHSIEPFGGIQLIVTGDFYQLPPVDAGRNCPKFCFEALAWKPCIAKTFELQRVFRQRDMKLINMLNETRLGKLSTSTIEAFRQLSRPPKYSNDGIHPTELYPRRDDVDRSNTRRLEQLPGGAVVFHSKDTRNLTPEMLTRLNSLCPAPLEITLKVNAQVMLLKNKPEDGLVNGSLGIITSFKPDEQGVTLPMIRFTGGQHMLLSPETWEYEIDRKTVFREQLPLQLSWAMSIHKSQGQTIERVLVDLNRIFEKGQAYVALSRATSLDSLQILGFEPSKVMAHPKVIEFYAQLK